MRYKSAIVFQQLFLKIKWYLWQSLCFKALLITTKFHSCHHSRSCACRSPVQPRTRILKTAHLPLSRFVVTHGINSLHTVHAVLGAILVVAICNEKHYLEAIIRSMVFQFLAGKRCSLILYLSRSAKCTVFLLRSSQVMQNWGYRSCDFWCFREETFITLVRFVYKYRTLYSLDCLWNVFCW